MSKFAHTEIGFALDPYESDSAEAYLKRFTTDATKDWLVVEVPNNTEHGAKDNGDGTFTNPAAVPAAPATPAVLSSTAFQDVCETALGGGSTGRARFGEIVRAMQTSADNELLAVYKRYEKSVTFEKSKVAGLLTLLVAKGVASLTAQERTAILAGWPET